jgi:hypothetical protein
MLGVSQQKFVAEFVAEAGYGQAGLAGVGSSPAWA